MAVRFSPTVLAAVAERLEEMTSHERATTAFPGPTTRAAAAVRAQRHFKIASREPRFNNPWDEVKLYALDLLVGVHLNEIARRQSADPANELTAKDLKVRRGDDPD